MPPITVPICDSFSAPAGATIIWTNIPPSGCTLTQEPGGPWPFNIGPPIVLPVPGGVKIKVDLPLGTTYPFKASCCPKPITVTIT